MPNGGSDCCGECCYLGKRKVGDRNARDLPVRSFCTIREQIIEKPFYTYCANYSISPAEPDPIPIGPILRAVQDNPRAADVGLPVLGVPGRAFWRPSPDNETIRGYLLDLVAAVSNRNRTSRHFPASRAAAAAVWQLGEFREPRAVPGLRMIERYGGRVGENARRALAKIRQATSGGQTRMESKQPKDARQLLLDVDWLRTTYASHRFFLQRDVAWTVQKRLLDRIGPWAPDYRVIHNRKVPKGAGPQFDLAVVDPNDTVELALKFRFEPAEKLEPGKFPVVVWADVVKDVKAVQHAANEQHTRHAYSLFIDEGGYHRARDAPPNSRWEAWDIGQGTRIAVLISEA